MAAAGFEEGRARTGPTGLDTRDVVVPLTRTRVAETLTALGYPLFRDAAGNLGLLWAQSVFHIYLLGEEETVLQVRTSWHRRLALERLGEVLGLLDRWNREFIGPKCYVRVLDDGRLSVVAEASTPLGTGVSDHQLSALLRRGVGQGMRVVRDLEAAYPDPAGLPPEETP
ncbi:YbjN domain-containing protein [Georgenia sp. TF02-10]|uniref:YbjN domain-containing protein n=1 Tax=Georgenia sp. TF02-10 TaxID=2917725 RepID=UPI001FA7CBF4|nr:YbjN domain-containing protein [Georgenia sp. TF02-10]UNX55949.1 YbjN domain-containing protein [Georgenia sp. TF02-10]